MDTIPVICHSFDGKHAAEQWPRDPEEIATLAKFRLVVIEKFEGTCWDQCYVHPAPGKCVPGCDVENFMLGTARALKAANPKLSVLMYLNSVMLFPFYALAARYESQPSLLLHDEHGRLVRLQNDAGLGNLTVPDWGQAAARELWWEELRNYTATGLIDGVFADKARKDAAKDQLCNHGCGNLSHSVAIAWGTGHLQLMTEGQRMVNPGGVVMRKDILDLTGKEGTTNMNFDFSASLASIEEMAALRKKLTGNIYAYAGKSCSGAEVAAFLIGIDERMFLQCGAWLDEFSYPLGRPLGPANQTGSVYTRRFASGTVATFDSKSPGTASVAWASETNVS
eukprot:SAG22_NODE_1059_length_5764_cov_3.282966_1_plen_338_part_00